VTVEGCPKFVRLPDGGAAQIHAFYVNFHGIKVYSVDHFTYLLTFLDLVFQLSLEQKVRVAGCMLSGNESVPIQLAQC